MTVKFLKIYRFLVTDYRDVINRRKANYAKNAVIKIKIMSYWRTCQLTMKGPLIFEKIKKR